MDPKRVFLLCLGDAGRFALCASALDEHWARVAADDVGTLYAQRDALQGVPHLLRYGDLPEIAALAAPRPLWINGAQARFGPAEDCYRALGKRSALRCSDLAPIRFDQQVPAWVADPMSAETLATAR